MVVIHKENCNKQGSGGGGAGGITETEFIAQGETTLRIIIGAGGRGTTGIGESGGYSSIFCAEQNLEVRAEGGQGGHAYDSPNPFIANGGQGGTRNGEPGAIGHPKFDQDFYCGNIGAGGSCVPYGRGGLGAWNNSGGVGETGSGGGGGTDINGASGGDGMVAIHRIR